MTNPERADERISAWVEALAIPHNEVHQPPLEPSDEVLMDAIARHDAAAFATLYDRYASLVYSTALHVVSDAYLAQDMTQEVFVRLWRNPHSFVATRGRFLSWLMSVTRNRAIDELRSRSRRVRHEDPGGGETLALLADHSIEEPVHAVALHERQARVRSAVAQLPADQRRALELAYFGGLTQQEIATQLDEPLGTVKTRIRLAMQKLRRLLAEDAYD